jgi:hypothetical protein
MAKYEVVEMEKNTRHEDGTPIVNDRWSCESATDAFLHVHVRRVEAEIQGRRTDVVFEAREDGEPIDPADWCWEPDDENVFRQLALMGYTEEEILSVLQ